MNKKKKLIKSLCEKAEFDIFCANSSQEEDEIYEDIMDKLMLVRSTRNVDSNPAKLEKCHFTMSTFLPNLNEERFRRNMRMSRAQFYELLELIKDHDIFKNVTKKQLPIELQLAITLYRLGTFGNGSSIQNISRNFDVSDGGVISLSTHRVISAIISLKNRFIKWPTKEERRAISRSPQLYNLPFCVGFLDGTHIKLFERPEDDPDDYINRKNDLSIQLQLIVDQNKMIRHMFTGFPGSAHDARVYQNSDIAIHPERYFSSNEYIIGDSAYKLNKRLITPYRRRGGILSLDKSKFNKLISRKRVAVEHCNGVLKGRFGSLNGLIMRINKRTGHKYACDWITTCCILYNFTLKDPWTDIDILHDIQDGLPNLDDIDNDYVTDDDSDDVAVDKRNALNVYINNPI